MIAIIALHLAAAVKHRLINRDGVFERMLVWRGPKTAPRD
jgi:cytochrome b561